MINIETPLSPNGNATKTASSIEPIDPKALNLTPARLVEMYRSKDAKTQERQDALLEKFQKLESEGATLFHLTITYKPYGTRIYGESDVNKFFINFYLRQFLPHLFHKRSWTKTQRVNQPICYAFIDEHSVAGSPIRGARNGLESRLTLSRTIRLHHHCIVASWPSSTPELIKLVGVNTLCGFSKKIMTSDLKVCDPERLMYASKMHYKYPDFLGFGYGKN
jgi:hypothetical protein